MVEHHGFQCQSVKLISLSLMHSMLLPSLWPIGTHGCLRLSYKYAFDTGTQNFLYFSTAPHALLLVLQYSRFIKNGWTILDTIQDERTLAAMYQHQNSSTEMVVVTTNTDTSSTTANWDFGSTSPVQYALELYRTSASENFTRLPDVLLPMSGRLQYDLPAQSITTFHFTYGAAATLATAG